jgi:hypothetical protein
MYKTLRQAIDDLYALSQVADREEAERIQEIIERIQSLGEHEDDQADIYMKLSRL